jgi:hypothetical protein
MAGLRPQPEELSERGEAVVRGGGWILAEGDPFEFAKVVLSLQLGVPVTTVMPSRAQCEPVPVDRITVRRAPSIGAVK